jgi:hypothetical protein
MSAKEMFEELGYEILKETKTQLFYIKKYNGFWGGEHIHFDLKNKLVAIFTITGSNNRNARSLNYEELKAIQQQIKELGWESDK